MNKKYLLHICTSFGHLDLHYTSETIEKLKAKTYEILLDTMQALEDKEEFNAHIYSVLDLQYRSKIVPAVWELHHTQAAEDSSLYLKGNKYLTEKEIIQGATHI